MEIKRIKKNKTWVPGDEEKTHSTTTAYCIDAYKKDFVKRNGAKKKCI